MIQGLVLLSTTLLLYACHTSTNTKPSDTGKLDTAETDTDIDADTDTDSDTDVDTDTDSDTDTGTNPCDDGNPSTSPQIAWLKSQIGMTGLVDSYKDDGTDNAYLYDQALSIIAFTDAGEYCEAQQVTDELAGLQNADGSWFTCYSAQNGSDCESNEHTGPIAWIQMGINFYQNATGDDIYSDVASQLISWLDGMRDTTSGSETYGALRYGAGYPSTNMSTEHNLDADSAYFYNGYLNDSSANMDKADLIEDWLLAEMWGFSADSDGPYDLGVLWRGNEDYAWCTDPQSWGVLDLGATGPNGEPLADALEWLTSDGYGYGSTQNTQTFLSQEVEGFSYCTEDVNPPNGINANFCGTLFVWTEGTLGVAAALREAGDIESADYYFNQITPLVSKEGGIPYSFSEASESFPCNWPYESASAAAWYYFYEAGVNPFQPN